MEIICAGYPKTGSKSSSAALRKLGYKVADYVETGTDLVYEWDDFLSGRSSMKPVIAKYKKCGYQANQDVPGNFFWEDLFEHSPDAKVILTVRESSEKWKTSFINFMTQEYERFGNPLFWIFSKISDSAIFGPKMATQEFNAMRALTRAMPGFDYNKRFFTWQAQCDYINSFVDEAEMNYLKHNEHVKEVVPADQLLVWDVRDGWEPLCKFLGKPVPNEPIPHENKTGDKKYIEAYMYESEFWGQSMSFAKYYCCALLVLILVILAVVLLCLHITQII